jgi:hypothetical protein
MAKLDLSWQAPVAFDITGINGLATSTQLIVGLQVAVIDNTVNKYEDAKITGKFRMGAGTLAAGASIEFYLFEAINDTPLYPPAFRSDGTAGAVTFTNADDRDNQCKHVGSVLLPSTTGAQDVNILPFNIAEMLRAPLPRRWGLFYTHNTNQSFDATLGNFSLYWQGRWSQV